MQSKVLTKQLNTLDFCVLLNWQTISNIVHRYYRYGNELRVYKGVSAHSLLYRSNMGKLLICAGKLSSLLKGTSQTYIVHLNFILC